MAIQKLKQRDVDEWVTGLLEHGSKDGKPLQPATVRLALVALKQVTPYATRQGLVPRDPAEYVEPPKSKPVSVAAQDVWTKREVKRFLQKVESHRLYSCYLLSAYGLRRSEVCGLRWIDVDLMRGTLSIEQAHVEVGGSEHAIDGPKTARSRRTLPLSTELSAALHSLRTTQKRERIAVGVPWDETTHVCANEDGTPVLPRTYSHWFQRARQDAGLPSITLRNLRHTSVSLMLHSGLPASTVAAWHGHDVRMTTAVYNRVYDEGLQTAAAALFESSATGTEG